MASAGQNEFHILSAFEPGFCAGEAGGAGPDPWEYPLVRQARTAVSLPRASRAHRCPPPAASRSTRARCGSGRGAAQRGHPPTLWLCPSQVKALAVSRAPAKKDLAEFAETSQLVRAVLRARVVAPVSFFQSVRLRMRPISHKMAPRLVSSAGASRRLAVLCACTTDMLPPARPQFAAFDFAALRARQVSFVMADRICVALLLKGVRCRRLH
jgi:hypothetical protein